MSLKLQGPTLQLTTTDPCLFDQGWRNRALLLRLIGAQRLELVFSDDGEDLRMDWTPPPLPEGNTTSIRRRRRS